MMKQRDHCATGRQVTPPLPPIKNIKQKDKIEKKDRWQQKEAWVKTKTLKNLTTEQETKEYM